MKLEEFYALCDAIEPDERGCRIFPGAKKKGIKTRPYVSIKGSKRRTWIASRVALERKLGRPIVPGGLCCHHCDNGFRVEMSRLYEGSPSTNMFDRSERNHESYDRLGDTIKAYWDKFRSDPETRAKRQPSIDRGQSATRKDLPIIQSIARR
jgi:hypothetical protein